MKNVLGISLIVVGGGSIAYILSLKDKAIGFVGNESTKCDNLSYEKEKTYGDWQEFNLKNQQPTIEQSRLMANGDKKELAYWKNIDKQREDLSNKYGVANSNWNNSDCTKVQVGSDVSDCNRLKENITTLKDKILELEKDPQKNIKNSAVAGDLATYKMQLSENESSYKKNNCLLNTKSDVSVSDTSFEKCRNIDVGINQVLNEIDILLKKDLTTSGMNQNERVQLGKWQIDLTKRQNEFITNNCRNKIETKRLTNNSVISTKMAEQMEQEVLDKNNNEKNVYIGVGALVLLAGFYIVLKK